MGSPSHPTSTPAVEAMITSAKQRHFPYKSPYGDPELRDILATDSSDYYSSSFGREHVTVTSGSAAAIAAVQICFINPGDRCLVPVPAYSSYEQNIALLQGRILPIPCYKEEKYKPSPERIKAHFLRACREGETVKTAILNYPNNPTGATLSEEEEAKALASTLNELYETQAFTLILDEAYREVYFEDPSHPIYPYLSPALKNQTVIVGSASKSSSLAGERMGYVVCANPSLINMVRAVHGAIMICPGSTVQKAALADLKAQDVSRLNEIRDYYRDKSDFVVDRLNAIATRAKWRVVPATVAPKGAIFLWADFSQMLGYELPAQVKKLMGKDFIENSVDIAKYFIYIAKTTNEESGTPFSGVATVPGSGFLVEGVPEMEGHLRFCTAGAFATPLAKDLELKGAMDALEQAVLHIQEMNKHRAHVGNSAGRSRL